MSKSPVIFGEVLFDCYPDGEEILGGAPFNVAWNLCGIGVEPLLISSIGNDEEGRRVVEAAESWTLDTSGLQISKSRPTGRVTVRLDGEQPTYVIIPDTAYDYIYFDDIPSEVFTAKDIPLLYHGSLILRDSLNRQTLQKLRRQLDCPVFLDVNIRHPWFDLAKSRKFLNGVKWLKLNVAELAELTGTGLDDFSSRADIARAIRTLKSNFGVETVFVTAGPRGAFASDTQNQMLAAVPVGFESVQDTVGAGDAFSARLMAGLLEDEPLDVALQQSVTFAARVCQLRGATISAPGFYSAVTSDGR